MNIRQIAVLVAAAVLLLCFLSWAAAASVGKASFKLTEQSLDNLREEGLPNEILEKLEALKDQKFNTEDEFLKAVRQEIGQDQTISYKEQILQHAMDDIAEVKHTSEVLQAQNCALTKRLADLGAALDERAQKQKKAESSDQKHLEQLEQRVKELEIEKAVRDEATRSIIRDAISTLGSNINEFVALNGAIEMLGGWTEDFSHQSEGVLLLNTAELDFEIHVNEWTLGNLVIQYDRDISFLTTKGFEVGIDRINLNTAFLTIGDPQRFPPFLTFGQMILPFGISTGNPVADVLTIENPLTIDAFEMRNIAIGFGLGFPTPVLTSATPPVAPPLVRPLVIKPLTSSLMRRLGYRPPPMQPPPPTFVTPTPTPPLFNVGFYSYDGSTFEKVDTGGYRPGDHINATIGFRTKGNCGRHYDQLQGTAFCPWSIDVDVDYTSSVFDSRFLETKYRSFLGQIGFVPGMAVSLKATLGPTSFIGEWNEAISRAVFTDDLCDQVSIKPSAWQITLGHQFDWNPWVQVIGAQGDYLAIGYSETRNLAGVMRVFNGESIRVGSLPKRRFIVSVGEWVLESLKFAVEYSHNVDYPKNEGGTGNSGNAIFSSLTIVW
ncbi:MAG: hypothetical protein QMD03_08325 [Syntrophales bacterium]|nr:hypothetical protein [Syntrophales bacterium]